MNSKDWRMRVTSNNQRQPHSMEPTKKNLKLQDNKNQNLLTPWQQHSTAVRGKENNVMVNDEFMRRSNQSLILKRNQQEQQMQQSKPCSKIIINKDLQTDLQTKKIANSRDSSAFGAKIFSKTYGPESKLSGTNNQSVPQNFDDCDDNDDHNPVSNRSLRLNQTNKAGTQDIDTQKTAQGGSMMTMPRKSQLTMSNKIHVSAEEPQIIKPGVQQEQSLTDDGRQVNTDVNPNASMASKISTSYIQINDYYKQTKEVDPYIAAMSQATSSNEDAIRMPNYTHIVNPITVQYSTERKQERPTFNPTSFTRQFVNQQRAYKDLMLQAGVIHNQRQLLFQAQKFQQQQLFITGKNMKVQKVSKNLKQLENNGQILSSTSVTQCIDAAAATSQERNNNGIFNVQIRSSLDQSNKEQGDRSNVGEPNLIMESRLPEVLTTEPKDNVKIAQPKKQNVPIYLVEQKLDSNVASGALLQVTGSPVGLNMMGPKLPQCTPRRENSGDKQRSSSSLQARSKLCDFSKPRWSILEYQQRNIAQNRTRQPPSISQKHTTDYQGHVQKVSKQLTGWSNSRQQSLNTTNSPRKNQQLLVQQTTRQKLKVDKESSTIKENEPQKVTMNENKDFKDILEKELIKTEFRNSSIENSQHLDRLNETLKRQSNPDTTPHFNQTSGPATMTPSPGSTLKGQMFIAKELQQSGQIKSKNQLQTAGLSHSHSPKKELQNDILQKQKPQEGQSSKKKLSQQSNIVSQEKQQAKVDSQLKKVEEEIPKMEETFRAAYSKQPNDFQVKTDFINKEPNIVINTRAKNPVAIHKKNKSSQGKIVYSIESISGVGRVKMQKQRTSNRSNHRETNQGTLTQPSIVSPDPDQKKTTDTYIINIQQKYNQSIGSSGVKYTEYRLNEQRYKQVYNEDYQTLDKEDQSRAHNTSIDSYVKRMHKSKIQGESPHEVSTQHANVMEETIQGQKIKIVPIHDFKSSSPENRYSNMSMTRDYRSYSNNRSQNDELSSTRPQMVKKMANNIANENQESPTKQAVNQKSVDKEKKDTIQSAEKIVEQNNGVLDTNIDSLLEVQHLESEFIGSESHQAFQKRNDAVSKQMTRFINIQKLKGFKKQIFNKKRSIRSQTQTQRSKPINPPQKNAIFTEQSMMTNQNMVGTQRIMEQEIDKVRRLIEMQELRDQTYSDQAIISDDTKPKQHFVVPSPKISSKQVQPTSTKRLLDGPITLSRDDNSRYVVASNQTKITKKKSQSSEQTFSQIPDQGLMSRQIHDQSRILVFQQTASTQALLRKDRQKDGQDTTNVIYATNQSPAGTQSQSKFGLQVDFQSTQVRMPSQMRSSPRVLTMHYNQKEGNIQLQQQTKYQYEQALDSQQNSNMVNVRQLSQLKQQQSTPVKQYKSYLVTPKELSENSPQHKINPTEYHLTYKIRPWTKNDVHEGIQFSSDQCSDNRKKVAGSELLRYTDIEQIILSKDDHPQRNIQDSKKKAMASRNRNSIHHYISQIDHQPGNDLLANQPTQFTTKNDYKTKNQALMQQRKNKEGIKEPILEEQGSPLLTPTNLTQQENSMLMVKEIPSLSHYNRASSAINVSEQNVKASSISTKNNTDKQAALLITEMSQISPINQQDKHETTIVESKRAKADLLQQTEKGDQMFDEQDPLRKSFNSQLNRKSTYDKKNSLVVELERNVNTQHGQRPRIAHLVDQQKIQKINKSIESHDKYIQEQELRVLNTQGSRQGAKSQDPNRQGQKQILNQNLDGTNMRPINQKCYQFPLNNHRRILSQIGSKQSSSANRTTQVKANSTGYSYNDFSKNSIGDCINNQDNRVVQVFQKITPVQQNVNICSGSQIPVSSKGNIAFESFINNSDMYNTAGKRYTLSNPDQLNQTLSNMPLNGYPNIKSSDQIDNNIAVANQVNINSYYLDAFIGQNSNEQLQMHPSSMKFQSNQQFLHSKTASQFKSCLDVPVKEVVAHIKLNNTAASSKHIRIHSHADLIKRRLLNVAKDLSSLDAEQFTEGKSVQIDEATIKRIQESSHIGQHGLSEIARRKYHSFLGKQIENLTPTSIGLKDDKVRFMMRDQRRRLQYGEIKEATDQANYQANLLRQQFSNNEIQSTQMEGMSSKTTNNVASKQVVNEEQVEPHPVNLPLPSSVYDLKSTIYYDLAGKWMHVPRVTFSQNKNIRNMRANCFAEMRDKKEILKKRSPMRTASFNHGNIQIIVPTSRGHTVLQNQQFSSKQRQTCYVKTQMSKTPTNGQIFNFRWQSGEQEYNKTPKIV